MSNHILRLTYGLTLTLLFAAACSASENHNDKNVADTPQATKTSVADSAHNHANSEIAAESADASDKYPAGVEALLKAYPDFIKGYDGRNIIFSDGSSQIYDDGKDKKFDVMLDNSDLQDMFYVPYRVPKNEPAYQEDAGRSRNEALFKKMYGASASAVKAKLKKVSWFGQTVEFASANGAADSLRKVAAELAKYPELRKYLKSSGTFYWRTVRGAKRQSAHSYGIAFDIGVDHSDYWLWKNKGANEYSRIKYANKIPHQIVEIFQKHGFIWGGSWYHYDTMHFEFRPEILYYAKLNSKNS